MQTSSRRVVITGIGGITPLGQDWPGISAALRAGNCAITQMPDWQRIEGLICHMAAPCKFSPPDHYRRRTLRSMGRVAQLAVRASELALAEAGYTKGDAWLSSGEVGVAYGSAQGSVEGMQEFFGLLNDHTTAELKSTSYIRAMTHTAPVNIGVFFGLTGRVLTTTTACTAASQAIGYAFEAIQNGQQTMMLAGGADELTAIHSAVFDSLLATSKSNESPATASRPFDKDRDGLVLGEGACTFVLEELDHAQARGANILGEVAGFATNADGAHITRPQAKTQTQCIEMALANAELEASDIGFVSAHATATEYGDAAEADALRQAGMSKTPVASLKGHIGHTLGACGSIEAWAALMMMNEGWFAPTLNLLEPNCGELDYLLEGGRNIATNYVMSNNFAFGGINTSLILKRWSE